MGYTFNSAWFPDVRAAIGLGVTEAILPDTTLSSAVFKTETERWIERNLTQIQYENPAWEDEAKYAAILYMASLAAPTIRFVDAERIAGGNITYSKVQMDAIAASLLARAQGRVNDILALDTTVAESFPAGAIMAKAKRKDLPSF